MIRLHPGDRIAQGTVITRLGDIVVVITPEYQIATLSAKRIYADALAKLRKGHL